MFLRDNSSNIVVGSDIGGPVDPAAVNLISGTNSDGITLASVTNLRIRGNLIGTSANGSAALIGASNSADIVRGIRLSRNRVYSNGGLQIDLGETNGTENGLIYGVTPNDTDDPDTGGNTLQNFPELTSVLADGLTAAVDFDFNSEANKTFNLEFFFTDICDSSGYGGAIVFIGEGEFVTDGAGDVSSQVILDLAETNGFITATATNTDNGTSEFSACAPITKNTFFKDGFETPPP